MYVYIYIYRHKLVYMNLHEKSYICACFLYGCVSGKTDNHIYEDHKISIQTFIVWALLLILHK